MYRKDRNKENAQPFLLHYLNISGKQAETYIIWLIVSKIVFVHDLDLYTCFSLQLQNASLALNVLALTVTMGSDIRRTVLSPMLSSYSLALGMCPLRVLKEHCMSLCHRPTWLAVLTDLRCTRVP